MDRLRRAAFPAALAAALAAAVFVGGRSAADLDGQSFTSKQERLRLLVPRGWRASDQASPLGVILWMARGQPQGQMELTAEPFNHDVYCSWPPQCRATHDSLAAKYACVLRLGLEAQHLKVEAVQPGPKEAEAAGFPSIWFEYDDGKHFLRQAITVSDNRMLSLILSAPSSAARATHTRAFEQILRTMHQLSPEEAAPAGGIDAAAATSPAVSGDAIPVDAGELIDGAILDGGTPFSSPAPATADQLSRPCST